MMKPCGIQLLIIPLNTAKLNSVIRFSVKNLLNSGCHVYRQFDCVEEKILMIDIVVSEHIYDNRYNHISLGFQGSRGRVMY
jgi:hypothetical protein